MSQLGTLALTAALTVGAAAALAAQGPKPGHVDEKQAQQEAVKYCDGGTVKSETNATEAGDPIYSFDIDVAHKGFVERVNVDARTGKVIGATYAGARS